MAESVAQLTAGSVIGGTYEAVHQIGRGGMGEVWLAKHLRLPKQVAIKVLHTRGEPLTEDAVARFFREAAIASRLAHPNIVEVHDYNKLPSGDPYIVLELLDGEPLSRRLKRGVLSFDEARSIVRQVGSALQAAHHQGVVHRDLKPDNIFIMPSPLGGIRVKVLDFGISKIQDSNTVQTQEAVLVGTPKYMSPEQATGANKDVGPQSDVFALGSIAYEMLTGEAPFSGESIAQLVFRVAYEKPAPLQGKVANDVPPSAIAAVERAMVKERAQRTPDIGTFVADFTGEPITLAPAAGIPAAPQLALVATPSMHVSNSLAMGDTAAPSGSVPAMKVGSQAPVVTQPATPEPPPRAPPSAVRPAVAVNSATATQAPAASTSTSSSFKFSAVWVTVAFLVGMGGVLVMMQGSDRRVDALGSDDPKHNVQAVAGQVKKDEPKVAFGGKPNELPEAPELDPAVGGTSPAKPPEVPAPAVVESPPPREPPVAVAQRIKKDPRPEPAPAAVAPQPKTEPKADAELTDGEDPFTATPRKRALYSERAQSRVDELRALANPADGKPPSLDTLVRRYSMLTEETKDGRAVEEMTAIVAVAMCRNSDMRWKDYFGKLGSGPWRKRVRLVCR